jgi:hypothetical protein
MSNVKLRIYTDALALFNAATAKTVTPTDLSKTLGADTPASKHAWFLKSLGFEIQANKDGRNVVSYTMLAAPDTPPAVAVKKTAPVAKPKAAPKAKAVSAPAPVAAKKSPTKAKKPAVAAAAPVMTDADIASAASAIDIADVNELDDRSDLPDYLR